MLLIILGMMALGFVWLWGMLHVGLSKPMPHPPLLHLNPDLFNGSANDDDECDHIWSARPGNYSVCRLCGETKEK